MAHHEPRQPKGQAHFSLTCADAVTWLQCLPSASVDLVITDPPYESLEKHRARGTTTRLSKSKSSSNEWFQIFPNSRFEDLFLETYRILRPDSHFYLFCDPETMFIVKPLAEKVGFKFWKPIIWDKRFIGMGYHYRARYECILFFEKGKRRLNNLGIADILECPRVRNGYPAEKPTGVIKTLIEQSSALEETVADPFMGSGSTGIASIELGRNFLGCDVYRAAFDLARDRLLSVGGKNLTPVNNNQDSKQDNLLTITSQQLSILGLS